MSVKLHTGGEQVNTARPSAVSSPGVSRKHWRGGIKGEKADLNSDITVTNKRRRDRVT